MTDIHFLFIAVLAGAGTFLLRYLPLRIRTKKASTSKNRFLHRSLAAIGPAAIVALIVVSLASALDADHLATTLLPMLSGLVGVVIGRKLGKGNIAVATLSGVAFYSVVASALFNYSLN